MKINFPARYCEKYLSTIESTQFKSLVGRVFKELEVNYLSTRSNEFIVEIPFNFWSKGERIKLRVEEDGVLICSRCVNSLQCFDWGKNK